MRRRRMTRLAVAAVAASMIGLSLPATADPIVLPDLLAPIDVEDQLLTCTELVPHAISLDATAVQLDVRVLLDGASQATAEEAVDAMQLAYAPLDITVVASYEAVAFDTTDAAALNQAAKDLYGGERPDGIDVVYTMSTKDLTLTGPTGSNVAGLADCIGGIRFDDHAFAVGEVIPDGPGSLLGLPLPTTSNDNTGKTMAHEVGHLLGGHHHYFSPEGLLAADPNIASLMGPAIGIISLRFSTLNRLMVRGHAQLYGTG